MPGTSTASPWLFVDSLLLLDAKLWVSAQVRSLRKRTVKKALALIEDTDNVKSDMLHSILVHSNDAQSEFSEPPSAAVSEASEAPAEALEESDAKHESVTDTAPTHSTTEVPPELSQLADALAKDNAAEEAGL